MEYTGQLMGGPDEGNLITATVPRVRFMAVYVMETDEPSLGPTVTTVTGTYVWDVESGTFRWELG